VGETFFWRTRKRHWRREIRTASNKQNWRKYCKSLSNCAWKSSADCQEHSRVSEHRQRNRKIVNSWHVEGLCKNGPKWAHRRTKQRRVFTTKQITVLEHLAYSPELAPDDFFLFPKIKEILKGRHFDDIDNIRSNTTAALKAIPQNYFQNCFEKCTRRWHRCIASQGKYFEGDHAGIQQWGM